MTKKMLIFPFFFLFIFLSLYLVFAAPPDLSQTQSGNPITVPSVLPCVITNGGEEICDGLDNDCNNLVDDNLAAPFNTNQLGVCENSVQVCMGASGWLEDYTSIINYTLIENESFCDGLNNDCDDKTDEICDCQPGNTTTCGPNDEVGECVFGVLTCENTYLWSDTCDGAVYSVNETCNGLDDDCDGSSDEDLENVTYCGLGACVNNFGVASCSSGLWTTTSVCDPFFGASDEVCDDVDNDCDGDVDEGGVCDLKKKSSGGGGSSSSSFTIPTSVAVNETNTSDNNSDVLDDKSVDVVFNKTIVASWKYEDNVASLALAESDIHFKRFHGLLPERYFANKSTIFFSDTILDPLEDSFLLDTYFIFERAVFDDSYNTTSFEELYITFTVDNVWLLENNLTEEDVGILYKSGGAWSLSTTDFLINDSLYQSRLSNSGLEELLIVADKHSVQETVSNESDDVTVVETEMVAFSLKDIFSKYFLFAIVLIVLVGGGIAALFIVKYRQMTSHEDDNQNTAFPIENSTASGFAKKSLDDASKEVPPVTINERVIEFIHKTHTSGATIEEIKQHLRRAHWPEHHIEAHINHYHKKNADGALPAKPLAHSETAPHHDNFSNQQK